MEKNRKPHLTLGVPWGPYITIIASLSYGLFAWWQWFTLAGLAIFFAVQTCMKVCSMLSLISASVSAAAHGASYVGLWALGIQSARAASGFLTLAAAA